MALCLTPDGKQLYVANSGLFEYKTVPGADDADRLHTGLHFPPFGYPSKEARTGMVVEGRSIPGLGEENDPRGSSLWTYALSGLNKARLVATLRLGAPIFSSKGVVVGGATPSAVVAGAKAVYVALAHEDALAVVSADGRRLDREIPLSPLLAAEYRDSEGHPLRGVMPDGLALSGGRLYVTEAGIDALGVIDVASGHVEGHLPVGWSPSAVIVSPDGKTLYVSNSKGKGSGPNGGGKFDPSLHGAYIGDLELGSISVIPVSLANIGAGRSRRLYQQSAQIRSVIPVCICRRYPLLMFRIPSARHPQSGLSP